ncbi:MAG: hypothetical protein JNL13_05480 [Chitinophagaceae bacterium]|nr:hypothetical protein [Chitinophagaceae bacterium]
MEQTIQRKSSIARHGRMLLILLSLIVSLQGRAQQNQVEADLSFIDGIELTPDNIFNFRIRNSGSQARAVAVSGRVYYRRSNLSFTYTFQTTVQPGMNSISRSLIPNPQWSFSESGLRDLFLNYSKLPQGTYEYCVTVTTTGAGAESAESGNSACVYQTVEDLFLINLVTPENDAKIYEYNPMLAWVVNYPFASELTYKLRVAELKQGQNPQSAITRNNPVYRDDHVMTTGTIYPVTARPLQKWQPYVWTVDAYYKGILLGGAEVWKFTIIDDSELVAVAADQSYTHINIESGRAELLAVGRLKLKYTLEDLQNDTLSLKLFDHSGKEVKLSEKAFAASYGDNRYLFEIKDKYNLKHLKKYRLELSNTQGRKYMIYFKYANPDLIR